MTVAYITEEGVSVREIGPGILEIVNRQVHGDGIDMGSSLVLERDNATWLAGMIAGAVEGFLPRTEVSMGPDHFVLFMGGSDWQPFIHVHNMRDAAVPRGGTTQVIIFTPATGRSLAARLMECAMK
jgi:hypothetical protein